MADLQSCYFCGAPDGIGEYAVVPPRLGGGDRSVVLCADCKTKLLDVMEPLIERAERGADAADDAPSGASAADEQSADGADGITMSPQGGIGQHGDAVDGGTDEGTTADDASPPDDGQGSTADPSTPADGEATPPQYRRAMRMLSNRPFPVDRSEVESMLANAYDLERGEIEAVLDHAESEGRLVAENGQLREP